jgi:putative ABC transport system substrate-binding protein
VLAKSGDDFLAHFDAIKAWGADAVISQPTLPLARVADSASKSKMPVACPNLAYTEAGGLMAYGSDTGVLHKQGAAVIDKVLKGRKPADLPVEITTNFRLVLNAKVASGLGITFPPTLLSRADDVVE